MSCSTVILPGGGAAIVCGPRPRQRCVCGGAATLLCDWKVPTRKSGTCDAPLCGRCTTHPEANGRTNFDRDLCSKHATEFAAWQAQRA